MSTVFRTLAKGWSSLRKCGVRRTIYQIRHAAALRHAKRALFEGSVLSAERLDAQRLSPHHPDFLVSILVPLYNTPIDFLEEMIQSAQQQTDGGWELCLADGSDIEHGEVELFCRLQAQSDPRIRYQKLEKNRGISENTNACIQMASGDYYGLLDHDDLLHPAAIWEVKRRIVQTGADFVYTDELTFEGQISHPFVVHLKPDFSIDNLRANNYICHFAVFHRTLLEQAGLLSSRHDGSQDYDLFLRLSEHARRIEHIPKVLYYWRRHPGSVASGVEVKPYCIQSALRAIQDHLDRQGLIGRPESHERYPSVYRVKYSVEKRARISVILWAQSPALLRQCLHTLKCTKEKIWLELIIIGNSKAISAAGQSADFADHIQLLQWDKPLNRAKMYDEGARHATGDYLLFLDEHAIPMSQGWIRHLLMYAQRPDVGPVGAKLLYRNGTIRHGGLYVTSDGALRSLHDKTPDDDLGYMLRLLYAQEVSSVSADCMMVRRSCYQERGGFSAEYSHTHFDADFCLRLKRAGILTVFQPDAVLTCHRRVPRRSADQKLFCSRWQQQIRWGDPYYNPAFELV